MSAAAKPWVTKIVSINGPAVKFAYPSDGQGIQMLKRGEVLKVEVQAKRGTICFSAPVTSVSAADGIVVQAPTEPKAYRIDQKRQFVRVNVMLVALFEVIGGRKDQASEGVTQDISAGGACMITKNGYVPPEGAAGRFELQLEHEGGRDPSYSVKGEAKVVRHIPGALGVFTVEWTKISESDRSRVARFISDVELRHRRGR